ncbi:hypothetical protein Geu3261_0183_003 [Komagataeibacter europaeus NBRC 3261]|uniref:Uncharacterized protein n=1 Tax=Komagataeibacter europaeus NBRC 3261 TaxID=1234669 RepID=A0A0D6Q1J9_KOMEU|nr:hypothetical protein [Komagataeibacter europaeus]GAN97447.1 hypothetical protein Geu3261_0183_003 [Komagataeibacter europaeus NBRC 3261]
MKKPIFLSVASVISFCSPVIVHAETRLPVVSYLKIRMGVPIRVRGPEDNDDTAFTVLKKTSGGMNGYISKANASLVTGQSEVDMSGTATPVIRVGAISSRTDCKAAPDSGGNWLNGVEKIGNTWYGLVHSEGPCDYPAVQTTKSMSLFASRDEGKTWVAVRASDGASTATILSDGSTAQAGQINGEGDYGFIPGPDGYEYAYGGRYTSTNWSTVRARAPKAQLAPGNWMKYAANETWNVLGAGGRGENMSLGWTGNYPAKIPGVAPAVLVGTDHVVYFGPYYSYADRKFYGPNQHAYTISGLTLAVSRDMVHFAVVHDPLVAYDAQMVNGRDSRTASDLYLYAALLNDRDGSRVLDQHHFYLSYTYVPPFMATTSSYLFEVPVTLSVEQVPQYPTVGTTLARYKNAAAGSYRTTTAPVVDSALKLETILAYLMTDQPINGSPVTRLEECSKVSQSFTDYMVDVDGSCAAHGYRRLRTAGYIYSQSTGPKVPADITSLYGCVTTAGAHFVSKLQNCENAGSKATLLGYALTN